MLYIHYEGGRLLTSTDFSESQSKIEEIINPSLPVELGFDESKHRICRYKGQEQNCFKVCSKCAISFKECGDLMLANRDLCEAKIQYKKATFADPKYAEAWFKLADIFMKEEKYFDALNAFDKALAIDSVYGKAMFGKAIALDAIGKFEEAMIITNSILELYDISDIREFKQTLLKKGIMDISKNESKSENSSDKEEDWLDENEDIYTKFYRHCQENPEIAKKIRSILKEAFKSDGIS